MSDLSPSAPKWPKTQHWPWSPSPHQPHRYHADPARFVNRPVRITEKLDGGNTCLHRGFTFARSSGQPATEPWFDWVKNCRAPLTVVLPDDLYLYGENLYAIHSIEYDPLPDFWFLFGALQHGRFTSVCDLQVIADECGFTTVPTVFEGEFSSVDEITTWFETNVKEPSVYGPNREGFVIRILEAFDFGDFPLAVAKYVRKNHIQTDTHWTKTWRPAKLRK